MKLNVVKQRGIWWLVSGVLVVVSLAAMALSWSQFNGPVKPGLDFIGGTRLQLERNCSDGVSCTDPIDIVEIRTILDEQGLEGSSLQLVGDSGQALSIRTRNLDVDEQTELRSALEGYLGEIDPTASKIDVVGPTIGEQLLVAGLLSLLVAFVGITVYLSLRFKFDYALLALLALLHDVVITLGIFSILGLTIGYEADSLFIVALLTIVGFSVNDTVVIYDRIRENFKLMPDQDIDQTVNDAVNQTLGRSINTTMTTALPLLAIVIFGGDTLKFFALALIVGFLAGAYSSIFIASTLLALWRSSSSSNTDMATSATE
ncbi:protein translocase subunit SecF [Leptolyngbyaceae cyanobacterium CCMR0082]|uniref:Protein-export membrane protein SecF n=2 Tax=Adonisia turfae TaxID=2950184 RepID=A0A6M0SBV3_9CYAN|nr:protein translocase subunit SecF [Adonisia turfae]NEZ55910.1 protein translocase subunit SecF [Adonisia turfae CCMR0081]NEZ65985.1 protein translocase subunit SecF [Adonisia turfae CCMR0082]